MLEAFDVLHFNSTNTMTTYGRYCDVSRGKVVSITHGSIRDNKALRNPHRPVRFGYLGPITRHKGFLPPEEGIAMRLWDSGVEFELHIYARIEGAAPYMVMHDRTGMRNCRMSWVRSTCWWCRVNGTKRSVSPCSRR